MSLFIVGLDNTIVNVALPSIGRELHASVSGLQWTVDAYTLVLASLLMLAGSMADRFDRRKVFQIGLVLFTLGSLARSLAPSLTCLHNARFDRADLIVSFVMRSGIALIGADLEDALDRGVHVRLLTTDYLLTTEPDALAPLLDIAEGSDGRLEVRVFSDDSTSFHPKAYLFWSSTSGSCRSLVGSSNLSRSGIALGIEWSLLTQQNAGLVTAFARSWADHRNVPLGHEWLRTYRLRVPPLTTATAMTELAEELPELADLGAPRPIQAEALEAVQASIAIGHRSGLVVLATGLGKTWLAAFHARESGARRVLFVAHREEILRQSRDVFRRVIPDCDAGLFTGTERAPDADVVFASVQSLGRALSRWSPEHFDFIVIDEFHHAAAPTYRRIIEHFRPQFLLGLTATPQRTDGADLLALCGDNLIFECGLVEGIARGERSGAPSVLPAVLRREWTAPDGGASLAGRLQPEIPTSTWLVRSTRSIGTPDRPRARRCSPVR
jgi:HKD family nuclease